MQYSSPPSIVHRQWYHIVLLINSNQVVMVVFMTTPRDRFIKVISKKSSVKTLFCNDDGCLTHIVQPSSKSPSCSSSSASHSTTSSPSCVTYNAAGAAACVSFATVVGEAEAGTDGWLSDAATFELSDAAYNRIRIGGWRSRCTTRGEKLDGSRNDLCRCRIIRVSIYCCMIILWYALTSFCLQ